MIINIFIYEIIYIWLYIRLSPAEPNVRPWLHNISQFSHDYTTCFIRGSNRLAGMDGTLGVAPCHAHNTKFDLWIVSQQFAATTLRRLRWTVEKKGHFGRENIGSRQTSGCAYMFVSWQLEGLMSNIPGTWTLSFWMWFVGPLSLCWVSICSYSLESSSGNTTGLHCVLG